MSRNPRIDPHPDDWFSNGRIDVAVDGFSADGADVLIRRFRVGEDHAYAMVRVPLDVFRRDAATATVLAMGGSVSPYRNPAPRPPVVPARRGFRDTCRRLQRAGHRLSGWRGFVSRTIVGVGLLVFGTLAMGWAPQVVRVAWGMVLGGYMGHAAHVVLGFLRAKRCRWLMNRPRVQRYREPSGRHVKRVMTPPGRAMRVSELVPLPRARACHVCGARCYEHCDAGLHG